MAAGAGAALPVVVMAAIVVFLVVGVRSGPLAWGHLLSSPVWDPSRGDYGATAMIFGTAVVSAVALLLAAPLGWAAAVAVVEVAPARWRRPLQGTAELLAVVPSIVYGLVGIVYLRPFVARLAGVPGGDSLLAAGLVLAVMVVPTVVAVSADALDAVPRATREAAAACGLTRTEVIRSAVLPAARRGMGAAALLALARALGETIAVFLLVGRADGRFPSSVGDVLTRLERPGQTLTTKLNGPESVLAGTSGAHWAALCALGLILLAVVVVLTAAGQRRAQRSGEPRRRAPAGVGTGRLAGRARAGADRALRAGLWVALAVVVALVAAVVVAVATRAGAAFDPSFWWTPARGASGGGIRQQLAGTVLLVAAAGVLAAPVGLGLGLVIAEYAHRGAAQWLRTLTLTLAGVPSILLGLWGYWLFGTRLGWDKSWLAGAIVLAVLAVPPAAVAVAAAVDALPPDRREAAGALGLRRHQLVRSVLVPQAVPGLVTGLLLGLARAAGETAPLLFTATVFSGAPALPSGVHNSPVSSLPTHLFNLAQDAAEPAARRAAWGSAFALMAVAGLLVLAAVPARRSLRRRTA
ncbi:MAG TPA: phosphate ABC transporter permease subunit PstC [Acidimicrobiales bacterium]|nr:phosphate ABC transporter permease subunit PstC [Acidimicrobiales bacterium]